MSQNLGSGQSKGSSNTFYMWLDSKSHKLNLLDVTDRALDAGPGVVVYLPVFLATWRLG